MIRWLVPSTWTVTGLVFVSWADLPRTCLTVTTGTTISCGMAPPWTNRAPPVKWKQVRPLGNPELHVALGPRRHARLAVPGRIVVGQVVAEQVALLGEDRAVGLLVQLALVRLDRATFP